MGQMTYAEKKSLHELEIQQNVEHAKDSSNYCTYLTQVSEFDPDVTVYAARRIGRSHLKKGKPCQDACMTQPVKKGHVFAVSDGVSDCPRSDRGSQFACEAAIKAIQQVDTDVDNEIAFVDTLCDLSFRKLLINTWLEFVKRDIAETDGKEQATIQDIELYGATLSLAIMTENRIVTLNLGDGQILLFNPVDAMRVRWHLPKEDSVTAALCDPDCYEDGFVVHNHDRSVYSGILLSTDGIYDTLSNYGGFFSYARQVTERFEANAEPLQPFCFLEKRDDGARQIDLSANISTDDCTIMLAVDHCPLLASTAELYAKLSQTYKVAELQTRADKLTVYTLTQGSKRYLALAQQGDLTQMEKTRHQAESLGLTTAKLLQPQSYLEDVGFAVAIYPDIAFFTPGGYFSTGKLKEKAEVKHGLNASMLSLQVLRVLQRCEEELNKKGFCLNDNARFLTFMTREGLQMMPEAISPLENGKANLLWQLFDNQIGTLTCDKLTRPVFSHGFNSAGPNFLNHLRTPPENLCYVKRGPNGTRLLINSGSNLWKLEDGTLVQPGESVPLTDGLSFEIPGASKDAVAMVKYEERKVRV
jgi:serine/threonine protein phosphatase PrpC